MKSNVSVSESESKFGAPELTDGPPEWHSQLPFSWTAKLSNQGKKI
jgi:hypothetical protein